MKLSLNSYISIGLGITAILLLIYCLSLRNSRDNAVNSLDRANDQLNQLISSNINLKGSIDLLEQQAQQNRDYITNLEQMRVKTQQQADQLIRQFKVKQHSNQTISNWANQPLPEGLY